MITWIYTAIIMQNVIIGFRTNPSLLCPPACIHRATSTSRPGRATMGHTCRFFFLGFPFKMIDYYAILSNYAVP